MPALDVVYAKIANIKNCLMAIEKAKHQEKDEEFRFALYELNLQRAVQSCIDLANWVISQEGIGLPQNYRTSFEILKKHGIIQPSTADIMVKMVGFRNISVHDYEQVSPEIVQSIVSRHLPDFEQFYSQILSRAQTWKE
jgi:uncharacterized protein YutE (UPF0331/DUF86 family)